ncbi:acetolactate synthase 3 regulatory subunit [Candidatus Omnitrophus magneticus]|uniref:Acetolactate synthase small subunit n=1 Tax=Candidatus Omnitrophus magneticus TaxID=1609969 RepID=A0A0F0CRM8_9BACT|nr:acetolactate synthase 3 regulatory subunit [Candidatus Omnitrophus magneticus]
MGKFVLSVLVENKFGVLARVAGLFSARGFNIDSLAVGETESPDISRMTIVVDADERILEQVEKQLNKLIDVIKVQDLTKSKFVDRELILIKVKSQDSAVRESVIKAVNAAKAEIIDIGKKTVTIEESGDEHKIKTLIELLRPYGIVEIVRTGKIALQLDI